jgi:hypothetical protein
VAQHKHCLLSHSIELISQRGKSLLLGERWSMKKPALAFASSSARDPLFVLSHGRFLKYPQYFSFLRLFG